MSAVMRAAVVREFGQPLTIEEVMIDDPGPYEVQVDIHAVAICASDLHANDGSWGGALPAVNGHEAAGIVRAVGSDVASVAPGDRVVVTLLRSCRECFYCEGAAPQLCEGRNQFAIANQHRLHTPGGADVHQGVYTGAFAEQTVVHHSQVMPIPDSVGFEAASLLSCGVITGYGAVANTVDVPVGASVVVVGTGGVGLNTVQAARNAAASPIIAVDIGATQLADAVEFGATDCVNSRDTNATDAVASLTDGRGADFVFVTVGSTAAIESAVTMARRGGTIVVVGMTPTGEHAAIETSGFAGDAKHIVGSFMGSTDLQRDIPLLVEKYERGELLLDELISGTFQLDDINDAIAATRTGTARRNVVVIDHTDGDS